MSGTSVAPSCLASSKEKDADRAVRAQLCIADVFPFPAQVSHSHGDSSAAHHGYQHRARHFFTFNKGVFLPEGLPVQ